VPTEVEVLAAREGNPGGERDFIVIRRVELIVRLLFLLEGEPLAPWRTVNILVKLWMRAQDLDAAPNQK
jgi:hypothetical protein